MSAHSEDLIGKFGAAAEKMPAFPKSVQKVLELSRNIDCQAKDIVSVIEKDPVMAAKILKVLNSPYYSLPNKITSIDRSIVYLGFNTVKNLALGIAAIGVLPRHNRADFDIDQYLRHSLFVAGIAKLLCGRISPKTDSTECFIAGLLHDFGKVVFAQFMPEEFKLALDRAKIENIPLHLAEREILGADHCLMRSMLAEKWQFPVPLVEAIRHHHEDADQGSDVLACVMAANRISKTADFGFSGSPCVEELPALAANRCGNLGDITPEDLARIKEKAEMLSRIGSS